jgi:hypothetical protein
MTAGSLGTSRMTETRWDPHIGHFSRASKLVSGNRPASSCLASLRSPRDRLRAGLSIAFGGITGIGTIVTGGIFIGAIETSS